MSNLCARLVCISSMSTASFLYVSTRNSKNGTVANSPAGVVVVGGIAGAFNGLTCFTDVTQQRKLPLRTYALTNVALVVLIECADAAWAYAVEHKLQRDKAAEKNDRPEG